MSEMPSKASEKVNYSFIRRVASELVEVSLTTASYKEPTIAFVRESLEKVISSESELDGPMSKTIQNRLLVLLDSEPSSSDPEEII